MEAAEIRRLPPREYGRTPALLLSLCMFTTGAAGLVTEYVLATTTTYILGNSTKQWSIIMGLMMAMMGVAGLVQRLISDRRLFEKFIAVEVSMALLAGFAPITIYWAFGAMPEHFTLLLYGPVAAIGFLIGFEIPLVMRIVQQMGINLKANLSYIYAMDYLGAFVGTLVWVYVLLKHFPLTEISYLVAGTNFLVAVVTVVYFSRRRMLGGVWLVAGVIACTAAALVYGFTHNRGWNISLEQQLYDDPIVLTKTTRYQHLVITRNPRTEESRLYINGNVQFSSVDEAVYHEQLVHPVMSLVPDHRRVLILGGGDGLALREVLKYPDVESVHLVDLDPGMVELASTDPLLTALNRGAFADARVHTSVTAAVTAEGLRPVFMESGRYNRDGTPVLERVADVQVIHLDADRFVGEISGSYNVIIVDLPDPNAVELAKLYSREFYAKLRSRLAQQGMVALQATSPYHAKESFLAIGRTLAAAGLKSIPYHDNVPSFGDWGWYLAWKSGASREGRREHIAALPEFAVETAYLTSEVFRKATVFGKGRLETHRSDVNTLMKPVLLGYYLSEGWQIE